MPIPASRREGSLKTPCGEWRWPPRDHLRPALLGRLRNRSVHGCRVGAELGQNGRAVTAVADDTKQHVVCMQVLVALFMGRFQRSRERTASRGGEGTTTRARRLRRGTSKSRHNDAAHRDRGNTQPRQRPSSHGARWCSRDAEQQMLSPDPSMAKLFGLIDGAGDGSPRLVRKALERQEAAKAPMEPMHVRRAEAGPTSARMVARTGRTVDRLHDLVDALV